MPTLQQTLYWNDIPEFDLADDSGTGAGPSSFFSTTSQWKDGLDTTYCGFTAPDDNATPLNADAHAYVTFSLQSVTIPSYVAISYLRVKVRARRMNTTDTNGSWKAVVDGVASGSGAALTSAFANYSEDFATNPNDGLAWTAARIDGQQFGVYLRGWSTSAAYVRTVDIRLSEFSIEVWGDATATASAAPLEYTNPKVIGVVGVD